MIKSSWLLILFFIHQGLIEPSAGALPASLQNLELDDITSLWNKFPSIIVKIKEAGRQTRGSREADSQGRDLCAKDICFLSIYLEGDVIEQ